MCSLKARAGVLKEPLADFAENKSVSGVQISIIIMNQTSVCPYFRFQCPRLVQATCFLRSLGLVQFACKPLGSLCQGASLSISDLQMRTGWYYSQLSNMLFWVALAGYPRVESEHAMLKPAPALNDQVRVGGRHLQEAAPQSAGGSAVHCFVQEFRTKSFPST